MSDINKGSQTLGMPGIAASTENRPGGGSAISWAAIFAGATAAGALSLLLLILGTGLGFSTISPWIMDSSSTTKIGFAAILWLSFTQLAASGMGGYLAGRMRTRWVAVHTDEVYFRDTVHGFLAWSVASLLTVIVLTSMLGSVLGTAGEIVDGTITEEARKASAYGVLWMFVTLLMGAFAASLMAVFGGRQRDA